MTDRLLHLLPVLAVAAMVLPSPASAQFGIAAGLNYDDIDDITIDAGDLRGSYESASGYHAGIFVDLGGRALAVRLGAFYRDFGDVQLELSDDTGLPAVHDVSITMIEFPAELRVDLMPVSPLSPFLLGGGVFGFPRSEDEDYDASLETMTMAGVVGAGVRLSLGSIDLMPEFRYGFGLSALTGDEVTIAGETFVAEDGQKARSVQLRLGLRF